jgi:predicted  nucleic acid-binding Zn-ribbon protein
VAEAELKTESADVEKEKADARVRTAEDEKLLAGLKEQRGTIRSTVNDSALAHYDRVMRQRKSALAEARDQKCMACFVMVRPQTWQEIRTNEQIITCNSCGRILYFDPANEAAVPEPAKKKSKARAVEVETEPEQAEQEITPTQ